jgi:hypothetical protein
MTVTGADHSANNRKRFKQEDWKGHSTCPKSRTGNERHPVWYCRGIRAIALHDSRVGNDSFDQ